MNYLNNPDSQIIIYQTESGQTKIEVRLQDETVWLTQKLLAELFQKDVRTINEHIRNILNEGELEAEPTIRKFRIVQKEGQRDVSREVDFYNMDMIISVGYRVKSHIATRFRQWATQRLREYIVKGFTIDKVRKMKLKSDDKLLKHLKTSRIKDYFNNPYSQIFIYTTNGHKLNIFILNKRKKL